MTDERLTELADHYEHADLTERIEQATWEEPGTVAEPMVTYALRLPKPVIDALRVAAAARGVKVSTLMREWLEERLARAAAEPDAAIPVSALLALVAERAKLIPQAS
jgi:hypothetical protein